MNVFVKHTEIKNVKHSEWLGVVGLITNTAYQIASGMGYGMGEVAVQALYITSIVSNTGSSIAEKWEKHQNDSESEEK